jgi:hypothetical protein
LMGEIFIDAHIGERRNFFRRGFLTPPFLGRPAPRDPFAKAPTSASVGAAFFNWVFRNPIFLGRPAFAKAPMSASVGTLTRVFRNPLFYVNRFRAMYLVMKKQRWHYPGLRRRYDRVMVHDHIWTASGCSPDGGRRRSAIAFIVR